MTFDLILRNLRPYASAQATDIGIRDGRIAEVGALAGQGEDFGGRIAVPGLVESHIHLDKAGLICRCGQGAGSLAEAVAAVSRLKRDFSEADVHARGARVVEAAIRQGTMHMRAHVEVDPRVGLRSFAAMKRLRADYAFALDLTLCPFPQEGLTNDPGAEALLRQALAEGADLIGGCPYTDTDPEEQIRRIFAMAVEHDVDIDFHLDFDLDPGWTHMDAVCEATARAGWQGRVTIGHATKLAAMGKGAFARYADLLLSAGVGVTALPSTDLYLNGRSEGFRAARGVAPVHLLAARGGNASVATNNVMNPFTPYGDASLLRMANLYANVMQLGPEAFPLCMALITEGAARLMRLEGYGLAVGDRADIVVLDATDPVEAFGGIAQPLAGFKRGRPSFLRPPARILHP
ncbi:MULTISPECIES: amidohydrolase family protein [unclassified Haematobacter]|uniref:amidohydrolase family protein n=1 Tax=unclassified Haematobacter TaxID=2640585 RepID=UPI0025C22BF5|nr:MULTISPECIES: amidohydrolase family protein [unclassified Haematobacter]